MKNFIIGIAGGSGCGKSTLSYGLKDKHPDLIEVVHFDDYQKEEEEVKFFEGMRNWDHPQAINFDALYSDLTKLTAGKEVEVMTKSSILNPEYEKKGRIKHVLQPKKIIIVEGYLALHNQMVCDLYDYKIFLDIPVEESMKRRDKITYNNESVYNEKILLPMHNKYVAPCKQLADLSIDAVKNNQNQVFEIVSSILKKHKLV